MNHSNHWLLDDYLASPPPRPPKSHPVGRFINEATQVILLAFAMYVGLNVIIPRYEVEGSALLSRGCTMLLPTPNAATLSYLNTAITSLSA